MKEKKILKTVAISVLLVVLLSFSTFLPQISAAKPQPAGPVTITSPQSAFLSVYGYSVATDGQYIVVGAYHENSSGVQYAGNVYIYNTTGTLLHTLTSPNKVTSGYFGWSVAIGGGLIVVGAEQEVSGTTSSAGVAYVFTTGGDYVATLTSNSPQVGGGFGASVAIGGNYVVVGAPYESSNRTTGAGNAYVFMTNGTRVASLASQNPQQPGQFGISVATDGKSVVVGASQEGTTQIPYSGEAYLFTTGGTYVDTLTSPNPVTFGSFGSSVAISGRQVYVGASDETYSNSTVSLLNAGHVYIFTTSGKLSKTISSPQPEQYGNFGKSLAISSRQIVVGASDESFGSTLLAGKAYVFATGGRPISTLTSQNPQAAGYFGWSVAIAGSIALVGAYGEIVNGNSYAGNAYIFQLK